MINKEKITKTRPPIVVVMGHVDHGKTTLLDTIRVQKPSAAKKRIRPTTEQESGGITQHIGAYEIEHAEKRITFIDTPGHEAFSSMRMRGAGVADVALLVVAADDGVKPQTKEALRHIVASELPFIVVINKVDKPNADIERTKNDLAENEIYLEGRGGKTPFVTVSARDGQGIDELLDLIILVGELEELTYGPVSPAKGYVLESHLDQRRGVTTTIVLTDGTLRSGDILVCGSQWGKVKIMEDFEGSRIKGAVPSSPVTVVGMNGLCAAGDPCEAFASETEAQEQISKNNINKKPESLSIEADGQEVVLSLVLKADTTGSLEAVVGSLKEIKSQHVGLKALVCDVGDITESDAKLAYAAGANIISFRAGVGRDARAYAEQKGVSIQSFDVIYELVEEVRRSMETLVQTKHEKVEIGTVAILQIFRTEPSRMIIGGKVTSGVAKKGAIAEIFRKESTVGKGKILQLQQGDDKKTEVQKGNEAGILFEGQDKIEPGDTLRLYVEEAIKPQL